MTTILTGKGQQIVLAAPGRPMLLQPLGGAVITPPCTGLSTIAGLAGWWDAGAAAGITAPGGGPIAGFGATVGGLADRSGAGSGLSVFHQAVAGTSAPVATPRLNGLLGGVGLNTVIPPALPGSGQQLPVLDPDQGLISAAVPIDPPTCCIVLTSAEATPESRRATPKVAVLIAGAKIMPKPRPRASSAGSTLPA